MVARTTTTRRRLTGAALTLPDAHGKTTAEPGIVGQARTDRAWPSGWALAKPGEHNSGSWYYGDGSARMGNCSGTPLASEVLACDGIRKTVDNFV